MLTPNAGQDNTSRSHDHFISSMTSKSGGKLIIIFLSCLEIPAGIGRVQSAADFDDDVVGGGKRVCGIE